MTHQLAALAEGRLVIALEGGYNLTSISDSMVMCARAVVGDPLPTPNMCSEVKQSAVDTVRNVILAQLPYWSCLEGMDTVLPDSLAVTNVSRPDCPAVME